MSTKEKLEKDNKFSWKVYVYDKDTMELLRTITGLTATTAIKLHEEYTDSGYYVGSRNY